MVVLAATGHRPDKLGGAWDPRGFLPVIGRLRDDLVRRAVVDELEIVSGMALGWDTIVAAAAVMARDSGARVRLVAAVPFVGQESKWSDVTSLRWYARLLDVADDVVVVSPGGYERWKMMARNRWMVDRADRVLACWNGTPGGTAHCVGYARLVNVPVVNVYARYFG